MSESHAEQLDPSVLGEEVGDADRPGDDFPPDEPLAVDDPSIVAGGAIARDDVAQRSAREVPDTVTEAEPPHDGPADQASTGEAPS